MCTGLAASGPVGRKGEEEATDVPPHYAYLWPSV